MFICWTIVEYPRIILVTQKILNWTINFQKIYNSVRNKTVGPQIIYEGEGYEGSKERRFSSHFYLEQNE